jgi:ribonuclease G
MKEVLINSTSLETRLAIVEDGELVEFLVEREATRRLVGDVYLGRVNAILPGIQAAFVDIGYDKAGFLHANDLAGSAEALAEMEGGVDFEDADGTYGGGRGRGNGRGNGRGGRGGRGGRAPRRRERTNVPSIEKMITKGQELIVQVTKEAIGTKGPRLSTQISLPGRYVVYMPNMDYLGISRRIESRQERARLRQLISKKKPAGCAIIARTACEGIEDKQIVQDINQLHKQWLDIKRRCERSEAPSPVHEEVGLVVGMMRDILADDIDRITLDSEPEYKKLARHLRQTAPKLAQRTKLHKDKTSLFDKYKVEAEIEKTLERKVWLKKGGYLIFDQTEALVAIDVNTGRFVGKRDQEETILETNLLAAREVPRQLRLRDIGGIIVIDFIDMESEANKRKVLAERARTARARRRSP